MGGVLALEPPDLVDLLLNLQGLEVVELGLVGLHNACVPSIIVPQQNVPDYTSGTTTHKKARYLPSKKQLCFSNSVLLRLQNCVAYA